jgi:hypothetical protein
MRSLRALLLVGGAACTACSAFVSLEGFSDQWGVDATAPPSDGGDASDGDICAKDCLGGTCNGGVCQPVVIASGQDAPVGVGISSDHLYWVAGRHIVRIAKTGGPVETVDVAADALSSPFDVAIEGSSLYWSELNDARVYRKPLGGGARQLVVDRGTTSLQVIAYIATGNGWLFMTNHIAPTPTAGAVWIARTDSASTTPSEQFPNQNYASGVATTPAAVYWARSGATPGLVSASMPGGSAEYIRPVTESIQGVAADGLDLFFLEGERRVRQWHLGDADIRTLYEVSAPFGESDIAVDAKAIYWTEKANGVVKRLAR